MIQRNPFSFYWEAMIFFAVINIVPWLFAILCGLVLVQALFPTFFYGLIAGIFTLFWFKARKTKATSSILIRASVALWSVPVIVFAIGLYFSLTLSWPTRIRMFDDIQYLSLFFGMALIWFAFPLTYSILLAIKARRFSAKAEQDAAANP